MSSYIDRVFEVICKKLPEADIRFLLIGGFAVNYYGYTRNTLDVDFMIAIDSVDQVCRLMRQSGFCNISNLDNVIFCNNPQIPIRIDFLKVDSQTMEELFQHAQQVEHMGYSLPVPSLHDLLAMKLFALHSNKSRRAAKDIPDVAYLTVLNDYDTRDLHKLCGQFATEEIFNEISLFIEGIK